MSPKDSNLTVDQGRGHSFFLKMAMVAEFCVFQKQGEILILKKMLNFLSFLVLLYVSGHFKQKKISKFFSPD